jgi:hypothetical protein
MYIKVVMLKVINSWITMSFSLYPRVLPLYSSDKEGKPHVILNFFIGLGPTQLALEADVSRVDLACNSFDVCWKTVLM